MSATRQQAFEAAKQAVSVARGSGQLQAAVAVARRALADARRAGINGRELRDLEASLDDVVEAAKASVEALEVAEFTRWAAATQEQDRMALRNLGVPVFAMAADHPAPPARVSPDVPTVRAMVEFGGAQASAALAAAETAVASAAPLEAVLSSFKAAQSAVSRALLNPGLTPTEQADLKSRQAALHRQTTYLKLDAADAARRLAPENGVRVEVSGKSKDWSKSLNNPEPHTRYEVDSKFVYVTDSKARVEYAEMNLTEVVNADRNTYQQGKVGRGGDFFDDGGHIFATSAGGPGEKLNMTAMDGVINRSVYRQAEAEWVAAALAKKQVTVTVEFDWAKNEDRPETYHVKWEIDGVKGELMLDNHSYPA